MCVEGGEEGDSVVLDSDPVMALSQIRSVQT
jgi:hypothetical protein